MKKRISVLFSQSKARTKLMVLIFYVLLLGSNSIISQEADIWKKYTGQLTGAAAVGIPNLPNYGFAGYELGHIAIPEVSGSIFDVTNYGAVANDRLSDVSVIEAAIAAADLAGGGIVFFPAGEFTVNETVGNDASIVITGSNIVLKGSGSGPNGTVINMKSVMSQEPGTTNNLHDTPPVFKFESPYSASGTTAITADASKDSKIKELERAGVPIDNPDKLIFEKIVTRSLSGNINASRNSA